MLHFLRHPQKPERGYWIRTGFLGFMAGYLLTVILNASVWLDMRLNTGTCIPLMTGLFLLWGLPPPRRCNFYGLLAAQLTALFVLIIRYDFQLKPLWFIPAILLREGIWMPFIPVYLINIVLGVIMITGNAAWIHFYFKRNGRRCD